MVLKINCIITILPLYIELFFNLNITDFDVLRETFHTKSNKENNFFLKILYLFVYFTVLCLN